METETWKPIPDWPGYEASDMGNVRSYKNLGGHTEHIQTISHPLTLTLHPDKKRFYVSLMRDGKCFLTPVHRLVLSAFVGPCPPNMECCHTDGNRQNNHLPNLRWDTQKNNVADTVRHKIHAGENGSQAKITNAIARNIRELYQTGMDRTEIARRFSLTLTNVCYILNGKTWIDAGGPIVSRIGKANAGINNSQAKINDAIARDIRELYQAGISVTILARQFSIYKSNICHILNGDTWAGAGGPIRQHAKRASSLS